MKENTPQGYKESALGIIPADWEVKRLGEISTMFSGGTPKTSVDKYYKGNIPFIKSGEIRDEQTAQNLTEEGIKNSSAKLVNKGDILYALYGANSGDCAISKINGAINQAILCIRPNANKNYISSILELNKAYYYKSYLQGGQGNLSAEIVKSYKLLLPPIEEQEKIAEVLGVWDKAIEKQTALVEKLELRKKGLMQQLLTGKKRLPGFSDKWQKVRLGEIGQTYAGLTGKNSEDFQLGNKKFITFLNILTNPIINTSIFGKVKVGEKEKQNEVKRGDLFFNTSSETPQEVGMCSVILSQISNLYLNSFCFGFRVLDKDVFQLFLSYYFRGEIGRRMMYRLAQGATRYNLPKEAFSKASICIPSSKKEQIIIAKVLNSADKEIEHARTKLEQFRLQKRGLMQQLLTGKKRVTTNT